MIPPLDIEREPAAALYAIYERALATLGEAEPLILSLPESPARDAFWEAHANLIVDILWKLRAPLVTRYRELDTHKPEGPPVTLLDAEDQAIVDALTPEQIKRVDAALLSDCTDQRRKVARIVGTAFELLRDDLPNLPAGFYAQRVQALADARILRSWGNVGHMGFSEVRLRRDALADVIDEPLAISPSMLQELAAWRDGPKRTDFTDPDSEHARGYMSASLNQLAEALLQGLEANPSKRWAMARVQDCLMLVEQEDDEGKERFGDELEKLMGVLGIAGSDGLIQHYLGDS